MIHEKTKCIFVHITKTAGSSITKALGENDEGNPHRNIFDYINKVGENKIKNYFTFAFVRNPWDRMVSEYHYQIQRKDGKQIDMSFEEYLRNGHINQVGNQLDWISLPTWEWDNGLGEYIFKPNVTITLVDFVGKYETLEKDMEYVFKKLHIKGSIPHFNKSIHEDYRKYYNKNTKDIVARLHERDIEYFGYKFL